MPQTTNRRDLSVAYLWLPVSKSVRQRMCTEPEPATCSLTLQRKVKKSPGVFMTKMSCCLKHHDTYDLCPKQVISARQQTEISAPSLNNSLSVHPPQHTLFQHLRKRWDKLIEQRPNYSAWDQNKKTPKTKNQKAFLVLCVCSIVFLQVTIYILKPE